MKSHQKIFVVFILFLLLNIPFFFISGLVTERQYLYNQTVENIGKEWGEKQKVLGPFLTIKYDKKDEKNIVEHEIVVFPETLTAITNLKTEKRNRGIYDATVYTANLNAKGYFDYEKIEKYLKENNIQAKKVFLSFAISNQSRIEDVEKFSVYSNDVKQKLESTTNYTGINSGVSYLLDLKNENIEYDIDIYFRGSIEYSIVPIAQENDIKIYSDWESPSFNSILPSSKEIDNKGFKADWKVLGLIRSYPQFSEEKISIDSYGGYFDLDNTEDNTINVKLFNTVNSYTQVLRATKYGILFVLLTLSIVYIFDIIGKKKTHIIQYAVVGVSLAMFYLLLLSLSEHLPFYLSYLISTFAIILPNSMYIYSITGNKKFALGLFVLLLGIYSVLYSILNMEQYALLTGTLLVLFVLYVVMYITRNIEKFIENKEQNI